MKQGKKDTNKKDKFAPEIRAIKSLDKYSHEILLPGKPAKANKLLKGVKLPSW